MKGLSVSNLAWTGGVDARRCERLASLGVDAVEVAPTALARGQWPGPAQVRAMADALDASGLAVSGLQSLLYGLEGVSIFDRSTWSAITARLAACCELAARVGADVMVFGSPKNRVRGNLPLSDAIAVAAEFFASVAPIAASHDVVLSLEPNPQRYGADFMTTYREVLAVVDAVGSTSVAAQIDTGCLALSGDDPAAAVAGRTPVHVHVSAPGLGALPGEGVDHPAVAAALRGSGFAGWTTLEMLHANLTGEEQLEDSIEWARGVYG